MGGGFDGGKGAEEGPWSDEDAWEGMGGLRKYFKVRVIP